MSDQTMEKIIGAKIIDIRPLTKAELNDLGFDESRYYTPMVIVLSTGVKLFPMQDKEFNGFGEIGEWMGGGKYGIITTA